VVVAPDVGAPEVLVPDVPVAELLAPLVPVVVGGTVVDEVTAGP
jgi:hypothetical protein